MRLRDFERDGRPPVRGLCEYGLGEAILAGLAAVGSAVSSAAVAVAPVVAAAAPYAGVAASVAGTAVSAVGAAKQGQQAQQQQIIQQAQVQQQASEQVAASTYDTSVTQQQAAAQQAQTDAQVADQQQRARRIAAASRAIAGEGGLTTGEGTPLLLMLDTAEQAEAERQRILYGGALAQHGFDVEAERQGIQRSLITTHAGESAALSEQNLANTRAATNFSVGSTLLTGATSAFTQARKVRTATSPTSIYDYDVGHANLLS